MSEPSQVQTKIDAHLRRAFAVVPAPRLSDDFEARLVGRLRAEPPPHRWTAAVPARRQPGRRWALRIYWAAAATVAVMTVDAAALAPAQSQGVAAAAIVIALVLQRVMHPWSLGRVMRDVLR